ncbi:hypothetical protein [Microbacterium maritypicum]
MFKRNAFGQLFGIGHPTLRFAGEGDGGGGNDDKYTPPATQEEFNRIISERAARADRQARDDERSKFPDYDSYKADAEKFRAAEAANKPKGKTDDDTPSGVSEEDVDKRINDALAGERLELALERVNDQLDKALEGRTFAASALITLDRKQFVKDGKAADTEAIKEWVEKNSKEIEKADPKRRQIPGQGDRDSNASGGSVSSGRDLYNDTHKKKSPGKD